MMRTLPVLLAAALLAQPPPVKKTPGSSRLAERTARPLVGAIRWDAWHGARGSPGMAVQRSLSPKKWHHRLPFFGRVISDSEVSVDGASQGVMDREIEYASGAGLDYWAFVTYDPNDPMSLGLKYYLSSERRTSIRFCLITEHSRWGDRNNYGERIRRFVQLMGEDTYLTVQGGRPLLYLGFIQDDGVKKRWGAIEEFRKAVDALRAMARQRGLANPYIVIMEFNPERGHRLREQLGADAIGCYAAQGGESAAPYGNLAAYAERFWERSKSTGSEVVPIVMSGWDRRPRVEHPVPWETWQQPGVGLEKYYEQPTPEALGTHLRHAIEWIRSNPDSSPAHAALIYAWNENDEGGWLVPTISEGTARLDAIRRVLREP
jgi:hypothetical protein